MQRVLWTNACAVAGPDCSASAGVKKGFSSPTGTAPDEVCDPDGCGWDLGTGITFMTGEMGWAYEATGTGAACTGGSPEIPPSDPANFTARVENQPPVTQTTNASPLIQTDVPEFGDASTTTSTTTETVDPGQQAATSDGVEITVTRDGDKVVTTTTTTTTTVKPDGTVLITKVTDVSTSQADSIVKTIGGQETVTPGYSSTGQSSTTQTINPDGSGSSTSTSDGDLNGDGQDDQEGEQDDSSWTPSGTGAFNEVEGRDEANSELAAAIGTVRSEAAALFGTLPTSGGSLPCWSWSILGNNYPVCLSDYSDALLNLRNAVILISLFYSVVIVLRI